MKTLTRHYDRLRTDERLKLLLAAWDRGDESEEDSLAASAPLKSVAMRDYYPYMMAYKNMALVTYIELLDIGAIFYEAWLQSDMEPDLPGDESRSERWHQMALIYSYRLTTKWAAWKKFCDEQQFPPELLWRQLPGYERLTKFVELAAVAKIDAIGYEKVVKSMLQRKKKNVTVTPLTVDGEAEQTRQLFDESFEGWLT